MRPSSAIYMEAFSDYYFPFIFIGLVCLPTLGSKTCAYLFALVVAMLYTVCEPCLGGKQSVIIGTIINHITTQKVNIITNCGDTCARNKKTMYITDDSAGSLRKNEPTTGVCTEFDYAKVRSTLPQMIRQEGFVVNRY